MDTGQIQLSIIVPIYNVEKWLKACLDSIYAISVERFEVVLVNDESPDDSALIIEDFRARYPHITKVVNRQNGGLSAARNSGLEVAEGEYIAFIDSDDFIDSEAFSTLVTNTIDKGLDIGCGNGYRYSEDNKVIGPLTASVAVFADTVYTGDEYIITSFSHDIFNNVTAWDKIYKRAFINRVGTRFVEGLYHEDVPFFFTLFLNNPKVGYFDCYFYYYRVREGSIMDTWSEKNAKSWVYILNYLEHLFKEKQVTSKVINDYLAYQLWVLYVKSKSADKSLISKALKANISFKKRVRLWLLLLKAGSANGNA